MLNQQLLEKYDIPAPRYTSYPTVPYWDEAPNIDNWISSLKSSLEGDSSWSLYLHIPFCESLCTFCGCNTTITKNHDLEEDEDQEYFWDDVIEPAFTVLQEKLDKVMEEI